MATCKDCLHVERCIDWCEDFGVELKGVGCPFFKNEAEFVPVVRCKDCMFWDTEKIGMVDECVCKLHSIEGIYSKYKLPNDFCSYGEREDNNADKR